MRAGQPHHLSHAKRTEVDGFKFDSMMEAEYYCELKLLQKAGDIEHIDVHPYLTLGPGDRHCIDFVVYWNDKLSRVLLQTDYRIEAIDVKGPKKGHAAATFRRLLKRWNHPIPLRAVTKQRGRFVEWT